VSEKQKRNVFLKEVGAFLLIKRGLFFLKGVGKRYQNFFLISGKQ
jgi:hypothetical protein